MPGTYFGLYDLRFCGVVCDVTLLMTLCCLRKTRVLSIEYENTLGTHDNANKYHLKNSFTNSFNIKQLTNDHASYHADNWSYLK